MNIQEACSLLGVVGTATPQEVKAAYRKVSTRAHPDRGGSDEQMSLVNLARDILTGKAPSSTDGDAYTRNHNRAPTSKTVDIHLSYEDWCSGVSYTIQDPEINSVLGKIINYSFKLDIPPSQDLDDPITLINDESYVEFVLHVDTKTFKRSGLNLVGDHAISLYDYLYSRFFYVHHPLLKKRMKIRIPEGRSFIGSQKNVIVLKSKGFDGGHEKGDMLISVNVVMPDFEALSPQAKALMKSGLAEASLSLGS